MNKTAEVTKNAKEVAAVPSVRLVVKTGIKAGGTIALGSG